MKAARFPLWLGLLGLAVVGVYLATATGLLRAGGNLVLVPIFAIGPVAIVGVLSIHDRLAGDHDGLLLRSATVFLVAAFALFTLMLVVQQLVALQFRDLRAHAGGAAAVDLLRSIQQGVDLVQLGVDVAFDIFYCLGVILLAGVMCRAREFGRILGMAGIVVAGGLLVLNLAAFPYVPAESGLIDLGPITGLWWVAVIGRIILHRRPRGGDRASG